MSLADHTIASIEVSEVVSRYPRTIGRNARLGSHGTGPRSEIVILTTDQDARGWGLLGGPVGDQESIIGRSVGELFDADTGVADQHRWLDFALHDLAGMILEVPVYRLLGGKGSTTVPCYDGGIYFDDLDPDDAPRGLDAVLANCAADTELGFRDFKLKIGRGNRWMDRAAGDARDIEVTRAVRQAYPDARILVDANDGYDLSGFCATWTRSLTAISSGSRSRSWTTKLILSRCVTGWTPSARRPRSPKASPTRMSIR